VVWIYGIRVVQLPAKGRLMEQQCTINGGRGEDARRLDVGGDPD
jgi:hypothetical protein